MTPRAQGPVEHVTWARAQGTPFKQVTRKHFFFVKSRFCLVFGLKTIKIEGIRRFRWSDEIRCEKLHIFGVSNTSGDLI